MRYLSFLKMQHYVLLSHCVLSRCFAIIKMTKMVPEIIVFAYLLLKKIFAFCLVCFVRSHLRFSARSQEDSKSQSRVLMFPPNPVCGLPGVVVGQQEMYFILGESKPKPKKVELEHACGTQLWFITLAVPDSDVKNTNSFLW